MNIEKIWKKGVLKIFDNILEIFTGLPAKSEEWFKTEEIIN